MLTQEWDMGKALDTRFMEGREQGRESEKIETARRMLADGLKLEQISRYTGIPVEKIQFLKPFAPGNADSIKRRQNTEIWLTDCHI